MHPLWYLLVACPRGDAKTPEPTGSDPTGELVDADRDGVDADLDCDDADPSVGAPADGYTDEDGDGYPGSPSTGCGLAADATDCDDREATVHPGAVEVVCNGFDDDCAGDSLDGPVLDGAREFASLPAAVDGAAEGDTLTLCPGSWADAVDIDRALTIEALDPDPAATVLGEVEGTRIRWTADAGTLTLRGLTLRGVEGAPASANDHGLIAGTGAGELVLEGCVVEYGAGREGGGIYATGPLSLVDTVVRLNHAREWGGGVVGRGPVTLAGATAIQDNECDSGAGGLYLLDSLTVDGPDVAVTANTAVSGGGLWVEGGGPFDAGELLVTANIAEQGGGAAVLDADWSGGTFSGNVVFVSGGGVLLSRASLSDAVVEGNAAGFYYGGGVVADLSTLTRVEIRDNQAAAGGGLANAAGGSNTLVDCIVEDNVSLSWGGGVFSAEYPKGPAAVIEVIGGSISGNTTPLDGGGVWSSGSVVLDGVVVAGNGARSGGAVRIDPTNPYAALEVRSSEISANTADEDGGGLWADFASVGVEDTVLDGNVAGTFGGGLWVGPLATAELSAVTVTGNEAESGGGAGLGLGGALTGVGGAWSANAPDDVAIPGLSLSYAVPGDGGFGCDATGCAP